MESSWISRQVAASGPLRSTTNVGQFATFNFIGSKLDVRRVD